MTRLSTNTLKGSPSFIQNAVPRQWRWWAPSIETNFRPHSTRWPFVLFSSWGYWRWNAFSAADAPFPTEFHNSKMERRVPKHLAVVIQIPTLHLIVLQSTACLPLFTVVIYDAPWFVSTKASRGDHRVWLEECPKQIERDFTSSQKQQKALTRQLISCFDKVDQEF